MSHYRVLVGFGSYTDAALDTLAGRVLGRLANNPAFPKPSVPMPELEAAAVEFHAAWIAAMDGGAKNTAAKKSARAALIPLLRGSAHYVQMVAGHNLPMLLSSGFLAAKPAYRPQSPLTIPVFTFSNDAGSTRLRVRLKRVRNARSYQIQVRPVSESVWRDAGIFTRVREIVLENLTPGIVYQVRVRGFGGSTGSSDWSDPVSRMAI